jgi:hypothetical protein
MQIDCQERQAPEPPASVAGVQVRGVPPPIHRWKGLAVRSFTPPEVKAFFCRDQKTKQSLAEAMIDKYPFLRRYLTNLPWSRRYWFHVFDAVGLGLMCVRKMSREKPSPRMGT